MMWKSCIASVGCPMVVGASVFAAPVYEIEDLGVVQSGDFASQGFGISPGGLAFARRRRRG